MSWLGKTIGAGLGAMVLGPFGAAAGAALGHWVDTNARADEEDVARLGWYAVLVSVGASAGMIQGRLNPKIERHLLQAGQQVLPGKNERELGEIYNSIVSGCLRGADECAQAFANQDQSTRFSMMCQIFSVVHADSPGESTFTFLNELTVRSGVPEEEWSFAYAFFEPLTLDGIRTAWLEVLGLPPNASEGQIKESYRSLCRELHPDKNQNAPAALRALGENKLKEVNEAYRFLTEGPSELFSLPDQQGTTWIPVPSMSDSAISACCICGTSNRVSKRAVLKSRCGYCHARLAQANALVATLHSS